MLRHVQRGLVSQVAKNTLRASWGLLGAFTDVLAVLRQFVANSVVQPIAVENIALAFGVKAAPAYP